jgi:hypothetical protein
MFFRVAFSVLKAILNVQLASAPESPHPVMFVVDSPICGM